MLYSRPEPGPYILHLYIYITNHRILVRETTRDQLECKISLKAETVDRLVGDPNLRAMIYCASEPISPFTKVDISFPHQVEIKINLDEVKSNLRGLKNKPGSTRPADITHLLRKRAGYENSMAVTYALTHKVSHMPSLFQICSAPETHRCVQGKAMY